jgi:hypothetical protein
MLKVLTKTKPWMVASLLVATTVFGQSNSMKSDAPKSGSCKKAECAPKGNCAPPCPQPCPPTQMCPSAPPSPCCPPWPTPVLNAAYNYPARTVTRCPWDVYFDVSFTYWQPLQDNMEIGFVNTTVPVGSSNQYTATGANGLNGNFVNMDFEWEPGFKIGGGINFDHDNWDMHSEYTWFRSESSRSTSTSGATDAIFPTFGIPGFLGTNTVFTSANVEWKCNMDILDVDLGRWYYVGTKLMFRPDFGARAAWIRQNLDADYVSTGATTGFTSADVLDFTQKSHSWGVGPKAGLCTTWMIGDGFRIFGNGEADILFTRYTKASTNMKHTLYPDSVLHQSGINTVRTHLDLELGFGWGTYLDCNNWYMDFAAGYEFQVFFDQNMFRHFTNGSSNQGAITTSTLPNGNLYMQGLTATFRLDF